MESAYNPIQLMVLNTAKAPVLRWFFRFLAAMCILLALVGCKTGKYEYLFQSSRPDTQAIEAVAVVLKESTDLSDKEKADRLARAVQLLQIKTTETVHTQQPSNAVAPATLSLRRGDSIVEVATGFMDRVDQLIKQLDWVIYLGCFLVIAGVVSFGFSLKFPVVSQAASFFAIGVGMVCFFLPSIIREYGWVLVVLVVITYLYFAWQNRRLVIRGAAIAGGRERPTVGISKQAIDTASGSGLTEILPPTDRK